MNRWSEALAASTDPRRIELARLLAAGILRLLAQRVRDSAEIPETSNEIRHHPVDRN